MNYSQDYDKVEEEEIQQKFAKSLTELANNIDKQKETKRNQDHHKEED